MINVYIISGFLGAGKTSFIKRLLTMNLNRVMLLENEFGEVGVDASFFDKSLAIKEINNGCICCSLQGDFQSALEEIEKYAIDTLIIEPSGVGKLSDIVTLLLNNDNYRLLAHVCVVDARTCAKYHKNYKEFFDDQVIASNAVILSHLDVADEAKKAEAIKVIRDLNDEVEITDRPIETYRNEEILDMIVKNVCDCPECWEAFDHHHDEGCHHHHDHHHHHGEECHHHHDEECACHGHHHHDGDEVFESFMLRPERTYQKAELENIFKDVDESVLRIKGYVKGDNTMWYFNYILNEFHVFEGPVKQEALVVVIGSELDKTMIEERFK